MTWRIAGAEERHLQQVSRIETASYPRPWSLEGFRHELRANPVALALVVVSGPAGRETVGGYLFGWDLGEEIRVNNLAVDRPLRRRGLGRMLLEELLARARRAGARRITLEVRSRNEGARELYAALGFAEVGRRPCHYEPDGDDALLLERHLDP